MRLTQTGVSKIAPKGKSFWVTDEGCQNLRLYVGASGAKSWYAQYRDENGKHQSRKLGPADVLTVAQAREMAFNVKAKVAKGEDVKRPKRYSTVGREGWCAKNYAELKLYKIAL